MAQNNQYRGLTELVALEAWHEPFTRKVDRADFHIDVAFDTERVGGSGEAVRFQVRLKRAEIVVVVPFGELAAFDQAKTVRDAPVVKGKAKTRKAVEKGGELGGKAKGGIGKKGLVGELDAKAAGHLGYREQTVLELAEDLTGMRVLHHAGAGEPRWVVVALGPSLFGRPWEDTLRLKVVDTRPNRDPDLPPSLRVQIRCRREDMLIDNIVLVDPTPLEALAGVIPNNRLKVAEAIIRTRLFEEGLFDGDPSDPYARMTLADLSVETRS